MWIRASAMVAMMVMLAPVVARAEGKSETSGKSEKPERSEPVLGEDEQLYSCKNRQGDVTVAFKPEIEVRELMTWVMGFTCKNFILDPKIVATTRKITIIAPNKMSQAEAYRVFLVALATINYTIVPKGNIVKVTEAGAATHETVPFYKNGTPDNNDQIVRYVFRPTYAQADSLVAGLTALKSDPGRVELIGSMLLVTDYASHVRDMMSFAKLIDVPKGSDGLYTIPILHADATKLSEKITGILGLPVTNGPPLATRAGEPAKGPTMPVSTAVPSKIIVDERTNTMIVAASEAGYNRVKALVDRLDISLDIEGGTTIHVYRLGSAIADELSKTLNEAISGQGRTATPPRPGASNAPPPPLPSSPADALGTSLEGQVRVIGDKPTNSLIVMSNGRDFLAIKDIIKQLDIPRRQVYIEALILEVEVGNGLDIGTSSHGVIPTSSGGVAVAGVQAPELRSMSISSVASASGLIGGIIGSKLSNNILGTSFPSYGLLFQALGKSSNTNVISVPSIIGLDNKETKYKVGINIPYKSKISFGGLTGGDTTPGAATQNVERKPLLLELNITPHISIDDSVLLEVLHNSEDLGQSDSELGPTWTTRSFDTSVLVRDQQTVVLGGLMQEHETYSASKVPILGDLPILGHLFKYTHKSKVKTNLVIMLTPYIVKDQMDLQTIRERKVREHDEFVRSFGALAAMPYNPKVDYRRKRGVIEEINRTLISVEEDVAARASFHARPAVEKGAIEYGSENDAAKP